MILFMIRLINYRMTNLSAAVGCAAENISKIINAKRKNFNDYYKIFNGYKEIKLLKNQIFQNKLLVDNSSF